MNPVIIQKRIFEIRGQRIMLDFHLAELYQVETKALNQAIKRNAEKFPKDFMFRINKRYKPDPPTDGRSTGHLYYAAMEISDD